MRRLDPFKAPYANVLARYILTQDVMVREEALAEANQISSDLLDAHNEPDIDLMIELHHHAQCAVAARWAAAAPGTPDHTAREALLQGDAIPLMMALILPHELAQRAHHEQRWRRDDAKLEAMFEQTDDLMVMLDEDGQIEIANPAFCRMTGWSPLEAATLVDAAWRGPRPLQATHHVQLKQATKMGTAFTAEWSVSPIFDRKGRLLNHVCIGRDVTRQRQIEDGLRENDKLRAVATLAAGIAHDFNNLLGSINGLAELCALEAPEGSRLARNIGRIHQAGDKAAALVRQMLDFSRQMPGSAQAVLASELLGHVEGLLRAALPRQVDMKVTIIEDGLLKIDLVQMEQVLLNIVRNAAHAMRDRYGAVHIEADRADPASFTPTGITPTGAAPGHVRLQIIDNGVGMAPDLISKIFEPFFTTKPVGEGTGLGLAAAHGIVSNHGGQIEVKSTPGVGSTFSIFLPIAAPDQAAVH
jgi:signal transduction histidine kinase